MPGLLRGVARTAVIAGTGEQWMQGDSTDRLSSPWAVTWWQDRRDEVVLADVRWYLDGRSGRAAYQGGHLPGAVFVDLDRWLAAAASPADGRHPLPDPSVFAVGNPRDHSMNVIVRTTDVGTSSAAPGAIDTGSAGLVGRLVVHPFATR